MTPQSIFASTGAGVVFRQGSPHLEETVSTEIRKKLKNGKLVFSAPIHLRFLILFFSYVLLQSY